MSSVKEIIAKHLDDARFGIIDAQFQQGFMASGQSAKKLKVVVSKKGGQLLAPESYFYMMHGRGPGGMPPIINIQRWLRVIRSKANPWAVAKKIAKEGTAIWRGERAGLDISKVIQNAADAISLDLGKLITTRISDAIKKAASIVLLLCLFSCGPNKYLQASSKPNPKKEHNTAKVITAVLLAVITYRP